MIQSLWRKAPHTSRILTFSAALFLIGCTEEEPESTPLEEAPVAEEAAAPPAPPEEKPAAPAEEKAEPMEEKPVAEEAKPASAEKAPAPAKEEEKPAKPAVEPETPTEAASEESASVHHGNWLNWRGPLQDGRSLEHYENYKFNEEPVWTYDIYGRGTPVIHDGRLYSWGYRGAGPDLEEVLTAHDPEDGEVLWESTMKDFISDTVYDRYSIGAPTVDPETGNVYLHTTYGIFNCHDRDGNLLWEISMMERFGRLTFPNGRAGAPAIEGNMVIIRAVSSYWGADGPARDRFFAFDKLTGDLIWSTAPGVGSPYLKDTSFSDPYFMTRNGRRVFYAGLGCGNIACVNVADGTPLWRIQYSIGGVNSSPVIHNDKIIAVHGVENVDTTETGRLAAFTLPADDANAGGEVEEGQRGAPRIDSESAEVWRYGMEMFTSSPVVVDGRVFQIVLTGELYCVDVESGEVLWDKKLGTSQLHASPAYADGLLYVPMNDGKFFILRPSDEGAEIVHEIQLEGNCLGSPAICNGMVYVHTTEKLYAFQIENDGITYDDVPEVPAVETGEATGFAANPSEVLLEPGDTVEFTLYKTDANGNTVGEVDPATVSWESFIPPTARVKAQMDAGFENGNLVAGGEAKQSAGMFKGTTADGLSGFVRGRVIESIPFSEDFEGYELTNERPDGIQFAYPPLPWIGARLKWEVRDLEGEKVLAKTLDNILFQRATSFIGHPESSDYTVQADVMTDGNRRIKSTIGLVNQRYIAALVGNSNILEVSSNHERVKASVPFSITANTWYVLKMQVVNEADGSARILAKAWERDGEEPAEWTIEVDHADGHKKGAPGFFGFSPQAQKSVFIDNIQITPSN